MSYMNRRSFKTPMILDADSYKFGHWLQLPKGTIKAYGYGGSRGGKWPFAVQGPVLPFLIKLQEELRCMDELDIRLADEILAKHLGPGIFNKNGWREITALGRLPVKIYCLEEGAVVPSGMPMFRIETEEGFAWLEGFMETCMLRDSWYGSTVATLSMSVKLAIMPFLEETCDNPEEVIKFMVHDFGYRGVSSDESAQNGSMAHSMFWMGSDTVAAIWAIKEFYQSDVCVFSVLATEHTTTTANSDPIKRDDRGAIEMAVSLLESRVKETGQWQIVACVNDTFDDERHVTLLGTEYRDRIIRSGGRFVTRCDSGDPVKNPIKICKMLLDLFGYTVNSKGYKVLPNCIRVLQGDGINEQSIREILSIAEVTGISAENFVFGMGGALLQHCDRDWLKFAMKCSAIMVGEEIKGIFKSPKNAPDKQSISGIVTTVRTFTGDIECKDIRNLAFDDVDLLKLVWDGHIVLTNNWNNVRQKAEESFQSIYKNT